MLLYRTCARTRACSSRFRRSVSSPRPAGAQSAAAASASPFCSFADADSAAKAVATVSVDAASESALAAAVIAGRAAGGCTAAAAAAPLLRGPVAPETVPFVRPHEGTTFVADTLTWRFYHTNAGCVVGAINNETYGAALARALYANLVFDLEPPPAAGALHGMRTARPD
jgi:hypothetical protein